MVIDVDITSDIDVVIKKVGDFFRREIPFTIAGSMNDTMFDVRRRVVGSTYPKAFKVRNKTFPRILWRVEKIATGGQYSPLPAFKAGSISQMEVVLRQQLDRGYMQDHVEGGTKFPRGSMIAVPAKGKGLRLQTGRIGKRSKPRTITNRRDTFLMNDKSGQKRYIAKRSAGRLEVLYTFTPQARIKPTFRFYSDAFDTIDRVLLGHWRTRMDRIVQRSRFDSA